MVDLKELVTVGEHEKYYLKCINSLNPVMDYGLKICPSKDKDEFKKKWNELRELINSWK
jgi:hypothetical protein